MYSGPCGIGRELPNDSNLVRNRFNFFLFKKKKYFNAKFPILSGLTIFLKKTLGDPAHILFIPS